MEYRAIRGFPADYSLLGFLLDGPTYGYDLQQRLRSELGPVWHVAWSQLYSVLHTLEERGWVKAETEESPSGPPRHTYAITASGRRAFFKWATAPVPRLRDVRMEFLVKLHFLRRHRPEELRPLLRQQFAALKQAIPGHAALRSEPWISSIALSFRRHQTESALAWIEETQRSLKEEEKEKE